MEKRRNETQKDRCYTTPETVAHHLLTDAQPVPHQCVICPSEISLVYILGVMFYGMEYPFGQFGSALLAVLPPGFLCTCSLAEHGKLKSS